MYKSRKRKNAVKLTGIALLAALTVGIGSTGAVIRHRIEVTNKIATPTVEITIGEDFEDDSPEDGVKQKTVTFTNNGNADVFLRVACAETWENEGALLANSQKALNEENEDADIVTKIPFFPESEWEYIDGWYYYKKVLPANKTTEPVLNSVDFSGIESKVGELAEAYQNANYNLHFQTEAVQASDELKVSKDAAKELFDKGIKPMNGGTEITDDETWQQNKETAEIQWTEGGN